MDEVFASIYEFGGLIPFYSTDLGDHLRGLDITCSDYTGTPWYVNIGCIMTGVTVLAYLMMYHIIDSVHFNKKGSWWVLALAIALLNFLLASSITYNSVHYGEVCKSLHISFGDLMGFGLSNAVVSFLLFVLITSVPWFRERGINCRFTTFWRP